jgi:hypothetical protein
MRRRYAIIRQSTDSRSPNSRIEFTISKKAILAALEEKAKLSYADPAGARNWHHDIASVYELPIGWRKPSQKYLSEKSICSGTTYYRSETDILAEKIMCDGDRIREDTHGRC